MTVYFLSTTTCHARRWAWKPEEGGSFSVRSCYLKLESSLVDEVRWNVEKMRVFENIWKSKAPLKVVAFSWKLLLDRILSRTNLARRNCLPHEVTTLCVLCGRLEESSMHLFLHCNFTTKV